MYARISGVFGSVVSNIIIWHIRLYPYDTEKDWYTDSVYIGPTKLVADEELSGEKTK